MFRNPIKIMSAKDSYLRQAYTELAKADTARDMERALRTANRILKQFPHESVAFKCKVVSLIQLNKFEETLHLIRKAAPNLTRGTHFERAYCEYRLYETEAALATLTQAESEGALDLPCLELKAQLYYRLHKFSESETIYLQLMKQMTDDFEGERQTNLMAARSQMITHGIVKEELKLSLDTFEHQYNHSCALLAKGQYNKAANMLNKANQLCVQTLTEDGVPEEEIEDERAAIQTQTAYCEQMLGQNDKALEQYLQVLKLRPSDASVAAVCSNNVVSIRQESNLFDARKKLKTCQSSQLQHKLLSSQQKVLAINNALLQLHSNQLEQCKRALVDVRNTFGSDALLVAVEAALLQKQKNHSAAAKLLTKTLKEGKELSGEEKETLQMTLAAVHLAEGNSQSAQSCISSVSAVCHEPAMVSVLCAINEPSQAIDILDKAAKHWQSDESEAGRTKLGVLLEQTASIYMKLNQPQEAARVLEQLRKLRPDDPKLVSRLMRLYGEVDSAKAEQLSTQLPRLMQGLALKADAVSSLSTEAVDVLEQSESILYKSKKPTANTNLPATLNKTKKRRARKRKTLLPKNMEGPLDPERWLPRQERSTFKKRKDKRAKDRDIGRGPQGAVNDAQDKLLDQSGKSVEPGSPKGVQSSAPATPGGSGSVPGPRQQRPAAAKKKKNKKF